MDLKGILLKRDDLPVITYDERPDFTAENDEEENLHTCQRNKKVRSTLEIL